MKTNLKNGKFIFHGVIIGIIIHGFMLTNDIPTWDDIGQIYTNMAYAKASGRWFLTFPARISSSLSISWINGLLSIFYISASAWLVSETLSLKSKTAKYMLVTIMLAFPTVASTLFYTQCADGYFFSLLLICLSTYFITGSCLKKFKHSIISYLAGILTAIFSLGIYQAYFPFGTAVLIISLIMYILTKAEQSKDSLIYSAKVFLAELVSLLGYVICTRTFLSDTLTNYKGISNMGKITLPELFKRIMISYAEFLRYFFADGRSMHDRFTFAIIIMSIGCLILIIWNAYHAKIYYSTLNVIILLFLILVFPLGSNLIYVFGADSIHMLMIYGLAASFVLVIAVLDISWQKKNDIMGKFQHILKLLCWISACLILVIEYKYILNDNMAYYSAHISYEQTYAYAERLVTRIENIEDYTSDDQVLLIGQISYDVKKANTAWMAKDLYRAYTGIPTYLLKTKRISSFINVYLGAQNNYEWLSLETCDDLNIMDEYQKMKNYPDDGSIVRMENGTILVKLSDDQK